MQLCHTADIESVRINNLRICAPLLHILGIAVYHTVLRRIAKLYDAPFFGNQRNYRLVVPMINKVRIILLSQCVRTV